MLAYRMHAYGGRDQVKLESIEVPEPRAGEILVRVQAAGLNPVDWKFRDGMLRPIYRPELPLTLGNDLAGTVERLGPGARKFAVGDRVFARCEKAEMGAFAEFATLNEEVAVRMPATLDFVHAASVPLAGLTALQALRDQLGVRPGWRLLVTGGSGGVGTFAVQLGRALGAEVVTTASGEGIELAKSLGAARVIDYRNEDFAESLSELDGVFDLVGGATLRRAFRVVKRGGLVVSIAGMPEPHTATEDLHASLPLQALFWAASVRERFLAMRYGVTYRYYFMHASGSDLEDLALRIDAGELRCVVDRTFPFAAIDEAFAYLEAGHAKGKVVVSMGP